MSLSHFFFGRKAAVALATCVPLLLAGCAGDSTGESTASPAETPTVTLTEIPVPTSNPLPECDTDPQASAIHDNLGQVPAPLAAGESWEYYGQSNYSPCADLSYALVWVTGSTHPLKQSQLMLFHRGEYLGVGALAPQSMYVTDSNGDSVNTRVIDFEAMERDQAPNVESELYRRDLEFWWNGERVEAIGEIPNQGLAVSIPH